MAEETTLQHVTILAEVKGDANKALDKLSKNLQETAKGTKLVSIGFGKIDKAGKSLFGILNKIGSISGAGFGFIKSIQYVEKYSKSLISLSAQMTKYGVSIGKTEKFMKAMANSSSLLYEETMRLFSAYEKGMPLATLKGAEQLMKNMVNVVGSNVTALEQMQSTVMQLSSMYPGLQKSMEKLDDIDKSRLRSSIALLQQEGDLSLQQSKALSDYINQNQQVSLQDAKRLQDEKKHVEAMQEMRKGFEKVALVIGQKLMPYIEKFAGWISSISEGDIDKFIGKIKTVAMIIGGIYAAKKAKGILGGKGMKGGIGNVIGGLGSVNAEAGRPGGILETATGGGKTPTAAGCMPMCPDAVKDAVGESSEEFVERAKDMAGEQTKQMSKSLKSGRLRKAYAGTMKFAGKAAGAAVKLAMIAGGVVAGAQIGKMIGGKIGNKGLGKAAGGVIGGAVAGGMTGGLTGALIGGIAGLSKGIYDWIDESAKARKEAKQNIIKADLAKANKIIEAVISGEKTEEEMGLARELKGLTQQRNLMGKDDKTSAILLQRISRIKLQLSKFRPAAFGSVQQTARIRQKLVGSAGGGEFEEGGVGKGFEDRAAKLRTQIESSRSTRGMSVKALKKLRTSDREKYSIMVSDAAGKGDKLGDQMRELLSVENAIAVLRRRDSESIGIQKKAFEEENNLLSEQSNLVSTISQRMLKTGTTQKKIGEHSKAISDYMKTSSSVIEMMNKRRQKAVELLGKLKKEEKEDVKEEQLKKATKQLEVLISKTEELTKTGKTKEVERHKERIIDKEEEIHSINSDINSQQQLIAKASATISHYDSEILKKRNEQIRVHQEALNQFEIEKQLAKSTAGLLEQQVSLIDSLGVGLGASVEMRAQAMKSLGNVLDANREQQKIQQNIIDTEVAGSQKNMDARKKMLSLRSEELSIMQKQMSISKALREGWISAMKAMTVASGRITKIMVTKQKNLAGGLGLGIVRSHVTGSRGAGGARNAARFVAGPGGGLNVVGGDNAFYKSSYKGAIDPETRKGMERNIMRGRADLAAKSATAEAERMRKEAAARGPGAALAAGATGRGAFTVPGPGGIRPAGGGTGAARGGTGVARGWKSAGGSAVNLTWHVTVETIEGAKKAIVDTAKDLSRAIKTKVGAG